MKSKDNYAVRRQKLCQSLKQAGVSALLVTSATHVRYLTGFTGEDSYLLIGRSETILISDGRFTTQIALECPDLDVVIRSPAQGIRQAVADTLKKHKLSAMGFEPQHMTVGDYEALRGVCSGVEFIATAPLLEELRQIKDAEEISAIRAAVRLAERGFANLRANLLPQLTERDVAYDLEHSLRRFGGKGGSFETIVAVGPRSALPHARPTDAVIGSADFVLVDWGADGPTSYKSDLTRVLVTGKVTARFEKIYTLVLQAQQAAIEAIRPGVTGKAVDQAARQVIEAGGFGKAFTHSTGHGIGLEIHEGPRLAPTSETELKSGMVVTVEPGIYVPGWGGVRIEDDILVTRDGFEVLSHVPKELSDCLVNA